MRHLVLTAALVLVPALAIATPQSNEASQASAASLEASANVPKAALEALSAGGRFVIKSVEASGHGASVVIEAVGEGVSNGVRFSVNVSREVLERGGIAVGASVVVTVIASGYLLSGADGRPFAYVPNERARALIHEQQIS